MPNPTLNQLRTILKERIALLDGAMGTMIQEHRLEESDFRGTRFTNHTHPLKGNNDILCLTRPDIIESVHRAYLKAGADLIETNTFNANRISQADYGLESIVPELNEAAAILARNAVDREMSENPGDPRFVIGTLGPTNKTATLSPDVNNPGYRAVDFDQLVENYAEQAIALLRGGVDLIMVETIFDTLNAKAALFSLDQAFASAGRSVPVMVSVTITDASGRTLSGQTVEAFWNSIAHTDPFSVGINCALGGRQMRPYLEELASLTTAYVSCHPNAGLPNAFGEYDETPDEMAETLREFAANGWVNLVGGCCGSTPDHIRVLREAVTGLAPRRPPTFVPALRLSGLEALTIH
ncbi:MAG: homocysteine S-methyltransferase family protein [Opitutaceae bacterium]